MSQLLISDANILIDLEDGELITQLFSLPYYFSVPDMLYYDELEQQHNYLLALGLQIGELNPHSMQQAEMLCQHYTQPSRYDCFALVLAKQEQCPLLTGDKNLRKAAENELVEVHGTLWVVNGLLEHQLITPETARAAYQKMKAKGRRLPWSFAEQNIKDYEANQ